MNSFPIVEAFSSIQGEGPYSGYPSFFVRVKNCNMYGKCPVGCDTYPRVKHLAEVQIPFENILDKIKHHKHLVITGGEPTLYLNDVSSLLMFLSKNLPGCLVEIETNGYDIINLLDKNRKVLNEFNLSINYSPKEYKADKIIPVAESILTFPVNLAVKIVVWENNTVVQCVKGLASSNISKYVWLMPRGSTPCELDDSWPIVLDLALEYNLKTTSRIHIYSKAL